jgi:Asp-tRNA(Asn)/Glu-tRNA(Gln) amidotransferase A subunit family amidase
VSFDYEAFDAVGLADLVRRGEVKAEEVLEAALERLESRNPVVNAVVARCDPGPETPAADAPLPGVPYLVKDLNCHVAGVPTTHGSRLFADHVPTVDSVVVTRLRHAGLRVLGKTNSPEFGLTATTAPTLFGPTRNPWHLGCSPGGSSGGAAAAVAAGIVPAAHATDGGGSIRIPASCCGLFGLKPTRGRVSMAPHAGEGWAGMSIGHAVTRSVRDSAVLLDAVAGPAPGDPYWAPPAVRPFAEEVGADPGRLRVALVTSPPSGLPVDAACVAAAEDAAALLGGLGHEVEATAWPAGTGALLGSTFVIMSANLVATVHERLEALGRPLADGDLEAGTRTTYETGLRVTGEQYARAVRALHALGRLMADFHERYDVVCTPTLAEPPCALDWLDPNGDAATYRSRIVRYVGFTQLFNATGQPAMSVPLSWTAGDGGRLPVGVQFAAPFGDEARLFRLAGQLEAARPWFAERAPLVAGAAT